MRLKIQKFPLYPQPLFAVPQSFPSSGHKERFVRWRGEDTTADDGEGEEGKAKMSLRFAISSRHEATVAVAARLERVGRIIQGVTVEY